MWAKKLRVLVNKMVGSSHTLIAIRMVRSKLRKREENNNLGSPGGPGLHHAASNRQPTVAVPDAAKSHPGNGLGRSVVLEAAVVSVTASTTTTISTVSGGTSPATAEAAADTESDAASPVSSPDCEDDKVPPLELFLWSSCPSQQLALYSGTQDPLVRALPCEAPQDSKGLRKNLRGKWRRLVKKKPEDSCCSIPPELRDQLKQIYVY